MSLNKTSDSLTTTRRNGWQVSGVGDVVAGDDRRGGGVKVSFFAPFTWSDQSKSGGKRSVLSTAGKDGKNSSLRGGGVTGNRKIDIVIRYWSPHWLWNRPLWAVIYFVIIGRGEQAFAEYGFTICFQNGAYQSSPPWYGRAMSMVRVPETPIGLKINALIYNISETIFFVLNEKWYERHLIFFYFLRKMIQKALNIGFKALNWKPLRNPYTCEIIVNIIGVYQKIKNNKKKKN